jgi:esterase/lipase
LKDQIPQFLEILLIVESPNDVRMLARFLEKLDYTIYAPLFTGHGTSDPLDFLKSF